MSAFRIDYDTEDDGRVMATIDALPGCMTYGVDIADARRKIVALALAVIADLIEHDEWQGDPLPAVSFAEAA